MAELSKDQLKTFLDIVDRLLSKLSWSESSFYRAMGNKLRSMRESVALLLDSSSQNTSVVSHIANRVALRSGQQEIFIGLYSADGLQLNSWEKILINLPNQFISRPIYANESQIQQIIKTKTKLENEAYVSLYVSKDSILNVEVDKAPLDKLGQKMLILKNNSINLENIHFFVHDLKYYQFSNGKLILT